MTITTLIILFLSALFITRIIFLFTQRKDSMPEYLARMMNQLPDENQLKILVKMKSDVDELRVQLDEAIETLEKKINTTSKQD